MKRVFGAPNLFTNSLSDVINVLKFVGPQRNTPANAPSVVATAGVELVRSISLKLTPGLS